MDNKSILYDIIASSTYNKILLSNPILVMGFILFSKKITEIKEIMERI